MCIFICDRCMSGPASKITNFGYTSLYIRQASPELGGAPIIMSDVGPGGIVNGTHQELSYIRCSMSNSVTFFPI